MLTTALDYLRARQIPINITDSLDYLMLLRQNLNLLSLSQSYFPEQIDSKQIISNYAQINSIIEQFFLLVNDNLFPLWLEDDLEEARIAIPFLPVDWDYENYEIEDLLLSEQFLLCLIDSNMIKLNGISWQEACPLTLPPIRGDSSHLDWGKLASQCQQQTSPLTHLLVVVQIAWHQTGSIWLDANWEDYHHIEWNQENIEQLRFEWQLADTYRQQKQELCDWLQQNPQHLRETINLWNNCQKSPYPNSI